MFFGDGSWRMEHGRGKGALRSFLLFVLFGVGLIAMGSQAWGRMQIVPRLNVGEEYTDNLFLTHTNTKTDFITTVEPGLNLFFPSRFFDASLDYSLHYRFYATNSSLNETTLNDVQRILFNGNLLPGRDFTVNFVDQRDRVIIDQRGPVVEQNAFINKVTQNRLQVSPSYTYRLAPTWNIVLGYQFEMYTYSTPTSSTSSSAADSRSHTGRLEFIKDFTPNFTLGLGVDKRFYYVQNSPNYQRGDVFLNGDYQVGPKLKLTAGVTGSDINVNGQGSEKKVFWRGKASYGAEDRLGMDLAYSEDYVLSVGRGQGLYKRQGASLGMHYNRQLFVSRLLLYAEKDKYLELPRQDRVSGANLDFTLPVTPDLNLNINGNSAYVRTEYFGPRPGAEDQVRYGGGMSLDYQLRILRFILGYSYNRNLADRGYKFNNYVDNIAFARIQARLPEKQAPAAPVIPPGTRGLPPGVY